MADEIDIASAHEEAFRAEALARITPPPSNGDGICRLCGERIESDRLDVLPRTPHCAECASAAEDDRARARKIGR